MNQNEHIDSFLNYYLFKCLEPNYAVLIKGKWGSGKSYYIKNYLNSHGLRIADNFTEKQKNVIIYLSLYGVSSKEEINEKVLERLHPIISSSKLDLLQKILKTAPASAILSALSTVMFDSEIPAKGIVEGLDIFVDYYRAEIKKGGKKKIVLVLDDFERANMPVIEMLGFVNECVEMLHIPCIIITEKSILLKAIEKQKDDSTMFGLSISLEKVVGKELQIETSAQTVVDYWVDKSYAISDEPKTLLDNKTVFETGDSARRILQKNRDLIVQVVDIFGQDNFRAMKHVLVDFDRFVNDTKLSILLKDHDEFARLFLGDFLIYQYAQELGVLNEKTLSIASPLIFRASKYRKGTSEKNNDEKDALANDIEWTTRLQEVFSIKNELKDGSYDRDWKPIWIEWFNHNCVDIEKLKSVIKSSIWYDKKNEYLLNKLCNWDFLNDAEIKECCDAYKFSINAESEKDKIHNPILLTSLFDSLLTLSINKNIEDTPENLKEEMYTYVENNASLLIPVDNDVLTIGTPENKETTEFANFVMDKITPQKTARRREYATNFFKYLSGDDIPRYEYAKIALAGVDSSMDVLELKKDDVSQFIDVILKHPKVDAERLIETFERRYTNANAEKRLEKEEEFLIALDKEIKRILEDTPRPQSLSMNNLRILRKKLENIFNNISQIKIINEECPPFAPEKEIEKAASSIKLEQSKEENASLANEDNVIPESHESTDTENDAITSHMDGNFVGAETKENADTLNISEAEK